MILLLLSTWAWVTVVVGIPRRGNEPWSVVLCKLKGNDFEPRTADWFREWMTAGTNPDTIESYFSSTSNGIYTIRGSNVTEWLQLPWTRHELQRMADQDPRLQTEKDKPFALYDKAKQLCASLAEQNGYVLYNQKITVINAEQTAVYDKNTGVLLTPGLIFTSVLAHEMVHSMNIGHSYSDRRKKVFPHSALGEYDDKFDLMSTANAHMRPSTYGLSGPGLNGPHLDYLGWLPMNRMTYFGRDGRSNYTLRLSSLSTPHRRTKGWLLILIPYDRDDPQNVFTVEYRTRVGNDAGIREQGVVIHKVHRMGNSYYSALMTHAGQQYNELTEGTEWVHFVGIDEDGHFQYIRVKVLRVIEKSHSVDLKIVSTFRPERCLQKDVRLNLAAPSDRYQRRGVPFLCLAENKTITQVDVDSQYSRDTFFSSRHTYGQNECKEGRQWRSIDAYDFVCVPPHRVTEADEQVVTADAGEGCPVETVHRNGFQNDRACVSKEEYARVQKENSESHKYLRSYAFFNGDDSVGP